LRGSWRRTGGRTRLQDTQPTDRQPTSGFPTCTRACVRACVCTYMSACVGRSLYLNMCACTCICIHVCACICMHIYVFVCLCISMRMHTYICMHVCTYIYMSLPTTSPTLLARPLSMCQILCFAPPAPGTACVTQVDADHTQQYLPRPSRHLGLASTT